MKNPPLIPITPAASTGRAPHGKAASGYVEHVYVEGVRAVAVVKGDADGVYLAAAMEVASVQDGIVFWRNIPAFCDQWSLLFSSNETVQRVSFEGEIAMPVEALVITKHPARDERLVRDYLLASMPMLTDEKLDTIAGIVGRLVLEVDPDSATEKEDLTDGRDETASIGLWELCESAYETSTGLFGIDLTEVSDSFETDKYILKQLLGEGVSFQSVMDRNYRTDNGTGRTLIARFEDWAIGLEVTSTEDGDEGGNANVCFTFGTGPDAVLDPLLRNWVHEEATQVGRDLAMSIGDCDAQTLQAMGEAVLKTLRDKGLALEVMESVWHAGLPVGFDAR